MILEGNPSTCHVSCYSKNMSCFRNKFIQGDPIEETHRGRRLWLQAPHKLRLKLRLAREPESRESRESRESFGACQPPPQRTLLGRGHGDGRGVSPRSPPLIGGREPLPLSLPAEGRGAEGRAVLPGRRSASEGIGLPEYKMDYIIGYKS